MNEQKIYNSTFYDQYLYSLRVLQYSYTNSYTFAGACN